MKAPLHSPAFLLVITGSLLLFTGCGGGGSGGRQFVTLGTAPVGGAFKPVGDAIASTLNENKGENNWQVQSKGTKGSQQNIRMLESGGIQLGMSNSAISYHGIHGTGVWTKTYELRTVVTLAPNVGLFITKADSGIRSLADLSGRRVAVGPAGAGFQMFLEPLLESHGVAWDSFTQVNQTYSDAVGLLGDGNIDAAFMGGAIPTPAVTQACTTHDIAFIPYDESTRMTLVNDNDKYPYFQQAAIPATNQDGKATYRGMAEDFAALNVGSMHVITTADQSEDLIYKLTKTIWENRSAIAQQHKAGNAINEKNAARFTGTPFHPGAIRFYREIGIWPTETDEESGNAEEAQPATEHENTPADDEGADAAATTESEADNSAPVPEAE